MSDKIEEVKVELKDVHDLKKTIFSRAKAWLEGCDPEKIDTKDYGETIDMVKDLAEVEKLCWEAKYFESIVKAMEDAEEEDDIDCMIRFGYNPNRYRSSGRYASKGHGSRMGYPMMPPVMWDRMGYPVYYDEGYRGMGDVHTGYGENGMPGYPQEGSYRSPESRGSSRTVSGTSDSMSRYGYDMDPEYGREYNMYRESRKHYNENKDEESKHEMSSHAEKHLRSSIETLRDIWKDVDPAMRKKMKMDLQALVGEMNV